MSLARQFFREMRPLFRILEEPLGRSPAYRGFPRSLLDEPFPSFPTMPNVDVTEEGNQYIIEAEVPGIKKESLGVRIGEGGRSLTIEGRATRRGEQAPSTFTAPAQPSGGSGEADAGSQGSQTVAAKPEPTQLSAERSFTSGSQFARTIYLSQPIDSGNVTATLNDGILTITAKKAEDLGSVQVPIQ
ncbi:HSP20-like chaperone [Amylocystis lapponica]|nr:HSP20-like chaperone [Amylocystis lapponica]